MYQIIYSPISKKKVILDSKIGKKILKKYIKVLIAGSHFIPIRNIPSESHESSINKIIKSEVKYNNYRDVIREAYMSEIKKLKYENQIKELAEIIDKIEEGKNGVFILHKLLYRIFLDDKMNIKDTFEEIEDLCNPKILSLIVKMLRYLGYKVNDNNEFLITSLKKNIIFQYLHPAMTRKLRIKYNYALEHSSDVETIDNLESKLENRELIIRNAYRSVAPSPLQPLSQSQMRTERLILK